jgi:hypothetical protein
MTLLQTQENRITPEELKNMILGNFANRDDLADRADIIYNYMSMAQSRIARLRDWRDLRMDFNIEQVATGKTIDRFVFLDDAVESQLSTTYNSSHRRIRNIHTVQCGPTGDLLTASKRRVLTRVPLNKWVDETQFRFNAANDTPTHYLWWHHDKLLVHPIPDENITYELMCTLYPAEITGANAGTQLELLEAEDLIVSLTTSMLALRLKLERLAAEWRQEFQDSMQTYIARDLDDAGVDMAAIRQDVNASPVADYWKDPFSAGPSGGEQVR